MTLFAIGLVLGFLARHMIAVLLELPKERVRK